jgi:DnaB-like helicase C terminal domain
LDDATGGWQNTDNIALAERIGEGKSYLALRHAYAAWMANRKVLFQSNEMDTFQIARRMIGFTRGSTQKASLAAEFQLSTSNACMMALQYLGMGCLSIATPEVSRPLPRSCAACVKHISPTS